MSRHTATPSSPILRRAIALFVAISLLVSGSAARADESLLQRVDGPWPTEKRVAFFSFFGVSVASLGYAVFAFAQVQRTNAEHNSDFPRVGSRGDIDCSTPDQCVRLRANRDEADAWTTRMAYGLGVSGVATLGMAAVGFLWPNGSARVAPSVSTQGASLSVVGSF